MNAARVYCHGLRIIRQPKWECLATFICSSMKQIAHIRQISQALRRRFGAPKKLSILSPTHFHRRDDLAKVLKKNCANARSVIARKIYSPLRASWPARMSILNVEQTFRCRASRKALRIAGRRRESSQLRYAFCLRAAWRVPDRRLDRTRFEGEIFSAEKKSDAATIARTFRIVFRPARRIRAAISVSSRAQNIAEKATA